MMNRMARYLRVTDSSAATASPSVVRKSLNAQAKKRSDRIAGYMPHVGAKQRMKAAQRALDDLAERAHEAAKQQLKEVL